MKNLMPIFCSLIICLALALPLSAAGIPTTLSYQGNLTDKAGTGITGSRTLVFSLYGVDTGGSPSWSEQQAVTVTNGKFSAVLGSISPLDVSVLGGDTWMGIAVLGEPEMTPRQKLTSVAYALRAKQADSVTSSDSLNPAGGVIAFAGTAAPVGWLMCDGSAVSRTTYAKLFTTIGTAHGSGDGSTTFNLPDYRGRFLRGVDGTAGNDPDKTGRTAIKTGGNLGNNVGSIQGDGITSHSHSMAYFITPIATALGGAASPAIGSPFVTQGYSNLPIQNFGGTETRPKNAYVNWIIKY